MVTGQSGTGRLEERAGQYFSVTTTDGRKLNVVLVLHCGCGAKVGNPHVLYEKLPPDQPDVGVPLMARCPACDQWVTLE